MSSCEVQASANIELYFYDELDPAERAYVEEHLQTCSACRAALEELTLISTLLASRPDVAAPADGNWAPFMARLEAAVEREPKLPSAVVPMARKPAIKETGLRASSNLAAYLAMAAVLTLVTSSVVYLSRARSKQPAGTPAVSSAVNPGAENPGRSSPGEGPAPGRAEATRAEAGAAAAADAGFASVSEHHFERSKLVVLGLAAKDPRETSAADWAYERELASALLDDTRLYRLAAQERGMTSLAGVMSDLELVLLQTSLSDERDAATLERLQRLIRKRDSMSKMNAVTTAGI